MEGDLLDVLLLTVAALFAAYGVRQGLIVGALSLLGFAGGGVVGAVLGPPLLRRLDLPSGRAALVLLIIVATALVGQAVASSLGLALRGQLRWRSARAADAAGGAVLSVVGLLLVAWFLASLVALSPFPGLADQARRSVVLGTVDAALPESARTAFSDVRQLVDASAFPQVFGGLDQPAAPPAAPPDPSLTQADVAQQARQAVVRVEGVAPSCQRQVEGTGFFFAPDRVMTNAHVVAGVEDPNVRTPDGRRADADVVLFDPQRDIAVLAVTALDASPLSFAPPAPTGADAVVVGFPEGGPYTVAPARVRGVQNARGPNIYQSDTVTREIYSVRGTVLPGNSGGPLVATDGTVYGVVFAASVDDSATGYVLTAEEVAPDVEAGRTAVAQVDTQGCA